MSVLVKICGINSLEAADVAARSGADFVGLNFHVASPRYLSLEAARTLSERMRGRARVVAIVCDAGDDVIEPIVETIHPELLQLHGNESPERAAAIRARFGVPLIKVVSIAEERDFVRVETFAALADMLLFDAKAPVGAERSGGHGTAFDWQLLRGRKFSRPWLLAGGLTTDNVARAIAASGAPGVDVSSGVEAAPGRKSATLIADFVARAKATQYSSETRA